MDIQQKLAKFSQILEILIIFLKHFGLEIFKNKVHNTLDVPLLFYGREVWTLRKKDEKRLISFEMKFFRRTAGTPFLTTKN